VRATGKRRGEAAEAAFLARATHLGFSVLLPWGESDPYDAAVDFGRRLLRVQVKSAAAYNGSYTIKTTGANGRVYTLDDIDFRGGIRSARRYLVCDSGRSRGQPCHHQIPPALAEAGETHV
jgi:hypothetical protein